jgi:hypothetical protein
VLRVLKRHHFNTSNTSEVPSFAILWLLAGATRAKQNDAKPATEQKIKTKDEHNSIFKQLHNVNQALLSHGGWSMPSAKRVNKEQKKETENWFSAPEISLRSAKLQRAEQRSPSRCPSVGT